MVGNAGQFKLSFPRVFPPTLRWDSLQKRMATMVLGTNADRSAASGRKGFPCLYVHCLRRPHCSLCPQHRDLHFPENLPGAAGFYSCGNGYHDCDVLLLSPAPRQDVMSHGEGTMVGLALWRPDRPHCRHHGSCAWPPSAVIPTVPVWATLWLFTHYRSTFSCLSEIIKCRCQDPANLVC